MTRTARLLASLFALVALLSLGYDPALAGPHPKDPTQGSRIVLRGTVVTPGGVIKHGYVLVDGGRIVEVSEKRPDAKDAIEVNTHGIIYPGLIDVHNHVPWNVMPRWEPPRLYANRYEWRASIEYRTGVGDTFNAIEDERFCDMNAYGEIRALVGGATSVMTTHRAPCIAGLVRNLDHVSGFYGTNELGRERIISELEVPPASSAAARRAWVRAARPLLSDPRFEGLAIHLAEGIDAASLEEFTYIRGQNLLNHKGVIIHGIPLGPTEFQAMAVAGTALVWSPRSNVELYGRTADVRAAVEAGVEVALAPDWAVTGSSNVLDELRFAGRWNREALGGRLTDRQLVEMVTGVAARIVGIDDEVGAIVPGLRADLLVIDGNHNDPYRALLEAGTADVRLVMVGGVPLYGEARLLGEFWDEKELEPVPVGGAPKALASPAAGLRLADVATRLRDALASRGSALAPIVED